MGNKGPLGRCWYPRDQPHRALGNAHPRNFCTCQVFEMSSFCPTWQHQQRDWSLPRARLLMQLIWPRSSSAPSASPLLTLWPWQDSQVPLRCNTVWRKTYDVCSVLRSRSVTQDVTQCLRRNDLPAWKILSLQHRFPPSPPPLSQATACLFLTEMFAQVAPGHVWHGNSSPESPAILHRDTNTYSWGRFLPCLSGLTMNSDPKLV